MSFRVPKQEYYGKLLNAWHEVNTELYSNPLQIKYQFLKWLKETHDIEEIYVTEINELMHLETKEYLQFNKLTYKI
jgi:hypothetical protein